MGKEYTRPVTVLGNIPVSGQVIFQDDFEGLLQWVQEAGDGDSIFELDPSLAFSGNQSLHMKTRTVDAAPRDVIRAIRLIHCLPSKFITLACRFYIPIFGVTDHSYIRLQFYDGANVRTAQIFFYPQTPEWKFLNSGETETIIPDSDIPLSAYVWHYAILRINFNTGYYTSLQVDHLHFDLSAQALFTDPNTVISHLNVATAIITDGIDPTSINIDSITISEI